MGKYDDFDLDMKVSSDVKRELDKRFTIGHVCLSLLCSRDCTNGGCTPNCTYQWCSVGLSCNMKNDNGIQTRC